MINSINKYLAKNFLIRFIQVTCGFALLIFLVNFIEALDDAKTNHVSSFIAFLMAFLQIPDFLNDISPSLILISAIITFFTLSSRSEISIMRVSGFSIWQVTMPIAVTAFLVGIFWITIFNQLSVLSLKTFHNLEGKYIRNDMREIVQPKGGIWIKQNNLDKKGEEIIIKAASAYKAKNVEFTNVTVWFFDVDGNFYKKIDTKKSALNDGFWEISKPILNEGNKALNKEIPDITIATDLSNEFVAEKILNNFQNVKIFSLLQLPKLIKDLSSFGFNSLKFNIYFNSLLSTPFIFFAMSLIACYFGLNHIRNNNSIIMIFIGMVLGLLLYITSRVVTALGSSGIIPIFVATWLIALICLAVGVLLIYQKEHL